MQNLPRPWVALFLALFLIAPSRAQIFEGRDLVKATLVPSVSAIVPGKPFEVGLLLEMAPEWHTYWEFSGDAGLPTKIAWTLPEGFVAGPIQWPAPESKIEPGDILTYAYSDRVLLTTTIVPAPGVRPGETITLRARASWLVCKELCIPGSAELELSLPVAETASPENAGLFDTYRAQVPSSEPAPYGLKWSRDGKSLVLHVGGVPAGTAVALFPLPVGDQTVGHPVSGPDGTIRVDVEGDFRGVLAVGSGDARRAWYVEHSEASSVAVAPTTAEIGLWTALFYGFLGGLILNLMPCVLPVISLKIFGFIRQAGEEPRKILAHGIAFMAGIFAWFLGLGLLIVALKSGGAEVTWAFQFQNPWFNIVIGAIVFAFALNLFGVFELVLPGRASTALESAGSTGGLGGSFFQGVFATLLATPCTAPFLGTALGFAFSQPAPVIFGMFASVAAGMASPYLILSARPGWMRFLPRPGAWMERLKQFMAFPLLATLVWILSILGGQRGVEGVVWFCAFLVCLGLACWIYGSFSGPTARPLARWISVVSALVLILGGGKVFLTERPVENESAESIAWVPFSAAELAALQKDGRTVFLDFTADWCITCKFNERTAINTPAVRARMAEKNVVPMKADWTNANPEITAALKAFGRVGVPFYVIYPGGDAANPIVLPELLTEAILLETLKNLP